MKAEIRAEYVVAEIAGGARLLDRLLHAFVHFPDLAMDVVVADCGTRGIGRDRQALDYTMRIVAQYVAILERSRFPLIRVAHQVLGAFVVTRHETPLETGREARAATAAQCRFLDFADDLLGRNFPIEDFLQRRIAAARFVIPEAPVEPVDVFHDHGVGPEQAGRKRRNRQAHYLSSSRSWSSLSGVIAHTMRLLLTRSTGASPHAPMHSASFSV